MALNAIILTEKYGNGAIKMDNLGFVRPDIVLLKTANRAEHCSVALTQNGEVCGALTRVHRVQPMGGRAVCYLSAIYDKIIVSNAH